LSRKQKVQIFRRTVTLPQDGHHLQDVDVHLLGIDEFQSRRSISPHLFKSETLGFKQRIYKVKKVEPDAAAVDLREDVADLVNFEVPIQFDVRNLVLVSDSFKIVPKRPGILGVACSGFFSFVVAGRSILG
jgi:hypothetical protein